MYECTDDVQGKVQKVTSPIHDVRWKQKTKQPNTFSTLNAKMATKQQ